MLVKLAETKFKQNCVKTLKLDFITSKIKEMKRIFSL